MKRAFFGWLIGLMVGMTLAVVLAVTLNPPYAVNVVESMALGAVCSVLGVAVARR